MKHQQYLLLALAALLLAASHSRAQTPRHFIKVRP